MIRLGNLHFLADLVHLGSEIDLRDNLGRTPLYLASKLNNYKIVEVGVWLILVFTSEWG